MSASPTPHQTTEPSFCLSYPELVELTGFKHRAKQAECLTYMGISHRITPTGDVKVLREDVTHNTLRPAARTRNQEPNFETLKVS